MREDVDWKPVSIFRILCYIKEHITMSSFCCVKIRLKKTGTFFEEHLIRQMGKLSFISNVLK